MSGHSEKPALIRVQEKAFYPISHDISSESKVTLWFRVKALSINNPVYWNNRALLIHLEAGRCTIWFAFDAWCHNTQPLRSIAMFARHEN